LLACVEGKILSVETIRLDREDGVVNTESTIWKEDSTDTKQFIFAVRVFSILQQTSAKETVGKIFCLDLMSFARSRKI